MNYPTISVIIPVFNEEKNIGKCLASIRAQKYPQDRIKILLIDDYSTDDTLTIARKYKVGVLRNGTHNIERAKSIGLENATSELVLFMDADNYFVTDDWIEEAYIILRENPEITGVESYKYYYDKQDSLVNRYCALFGINDPLVYYLERRGYLKAYEKKWPYPPRTLIADEEKCFLVKFDTSNLQTIGSNGYLTKKSLLVKTDWRPYFFHMDSAYDLVKMGYNKFARNKTAIGHNNSKSVISMLKKLKRNIDLFWKFKPVRRYSYNVGSARFVWGVVLTGSFVVPVVDSVRGYLQIPDLAWFLHPFISFATVVIYFYSTTKNLLQSVRDRFPF